MVLTHVAYVVFESAILIDLTVQSAEEAHRNAELLEISRNFVVADDKIDLTYRHGHARSHFAKGFNDFMSGVNQAIRNSQQSAFKLASTSEQLRSLSLKARETSKQQEDSSLNIVSAFDQIAAILQTVTRSSEDAADSAQTADQLMENCAVIVNKTIAVLITWPAALTKPPPSFKNWKLTPRISAWFWKWSKVLPTRPMGWR